MWMVPELLLVLLLLEVSSGTILVIGSKASPTTCIGVGEVIEAEVWGIYIGLMMAAELQIKKLLVESDSAIAVKLLNVADISMHPLATIIGNCHSLMQLFESCLISHVHRERNNIVDAMAKHGLGLPRGTTMFCSPPPQFAGMVYDDIAGAGRSRLTGLSRPCN